MTSEFEIVLRAATGEPVTEEEALLLLYRASTLDKSESRRLERHARLKLKDAALLEAAELLVVKEPDLWRLAENLEYELEKFQTRVWPRLKCGDRRDLLSPVEKALHRLFLTGEQFPRCQRRIHDFLRTQMT